jgi:Ca-activated chloride channel family protein
LNDSDIRGDHLTELGQGQPGPERINAVVVLTDGGDHDPETGARYTLRQLGDIIDTRSGGQPPVRIFTIGFSGDAESDALEEISSLTGAEFLDASDPASLELIFLDVVDNF